MHTAAEARMIGASGRLGPAVVSWLRVIRALADWPPSAQGANHEAPLCGASESPLGVRPNQLAGQAVWRSRKLSVPGSQEAPQSDDRSEIRQHIPLRPTQPDISICRP